VCFFFHGEFSKEAKEKELNITKTHYKTINTMRTKSNNIQPHKGKIQTPTTTPERKMGHFDIQR
jgi:hypothetical protein